MAQPLQKDNQSLQARKLLIVSDMPHQVSGGVVYGWGPTVREIEHLATMFQSVRHVAFLHPESTLPKNFLPYQSKNVMLVPVPPSGGSTYSSKVGILLRSFHYAKVILRELRRSDVIHVRCPASISLIALVILSITKHPGIRWFKYAGEWKRGTGEPLSYGLQRWWLIRDFANGWVTVNGVYSEDPPHIIPFHNPCLDDQEVGAPLTSRDSASGPFRILFAGSLNENKGVLRALEVVKHLHEGGLHLRFDIVGDGPQREELLRRIEAYGMSKVAHWHGYAPRTSLDKIYAKTDILLVTSRSEGWPKVMSEGMAYGVVPVANAISCIPEYLSMFGLGCVIPGGELRRFVDCVLSYAKNPAQLKHESATAVAAARQFTYKVYLTRLRQLLLTGEVEDIRSPPGGVDKHGRSSSDHPL